MEKKSRKFTGTKVFQSRSISSHHLKPTFTYIAESPHPEKRNEKIPSKVYADVAEILGIEENGPWTITWSDPASGLYIAHYFASADMEKYGWLRGVIVDLPHRMVYGVPFGYTPVVMSDQLTPDGKGDFAFTDIRGFPIKFNQKEVKFRRGVEGVQVNLIWHNSTFWVFTHRQEASKVTWPGSGLSVMEAYRRANGPRPEAFFDTSKKYARYSHTAILNIEQFASATKQDIGKGTFAYCGYVENWIRGKSPFLEEEVDNELWVPPMEDELPDVITAPILYNPPDLSLDEANDFLRYGWQEKYEDNEDPVLRSGEFVIAQTGDNLVEIASSAYLWRREKVGTTPNLVRQFCLLADDAENRLDSEEKFFQFISKYRLLPPLNMEKVREDIITGDPLISWPLGDEIPQYRHHIDRLKIIRDNLLACVPLHRQLQIIDVLDVYLAMKKEIIAWLLKNRPEEEDYGKFVESIPPYMREIYEEAETKVNEKTTYSDAVAGVVQRTGGHIIYWLSNHLEKLRRKP